MLDSKKSLALPAELGKSLFKTDARVAIAIGLLAGLLNYLIWIRGHFGGFSNLLLHDADQMMYASIARNLARGEGFLDSCIQTVSLAKIPHIPHPYLRGTLFPALIAPFFYFFGAKDVWAVVPVWLCYPALVAVSYLLARTQLSRRISFLAAVLIAANPLIIRLSVMATPDLPAALMFAIVLLALLRNAHPGLLGILCAFGFFIRPSFAFYLPAILYGISSGKTFAQKLKTVVLFLLGSLCILWPWMLRNNFVVGSPFYSYLSAGLLTDTPTFSEFNIWSMTDYPNPIQFAMQNPAEILSKIQVVLGNLFGESRPPVMWVFALAIPFHLWYLKGSRFRGLLLLSIACGILPFLLTGVEARYLSPLLLPLVVLALHLATSHELRERMSVGHRYFCFAIVCASLVFTVIHLNRLPGLHYGQDRLSEEQIACFRQNTSRDDLIVSDVGFAVTWQCDRTTVMLPARTKDVEFLESIQPIDFLHITKGIGPHFRDYYSSNLFLSEYQLLEYRPLRYDDSYVLYRKRDHVPEGCPRYLLTHVGDQLYLYTNGEVFPAPFGKPDRFSGIAVPSSAIRIEGDPHTGGVHVLTSEGIVVGCNGAQSVPVDVPDGANVIDFAVHSKTGQSLLLMDDGKIIPYGNTPDSFARENQLYTRVEFIPSGEGYYGLFNNGPVVAVGSAPEGDWPYFQEGLAADIALAPNGNGYYVLDAYGAVHPSSPDLPNIFGPYDADRQWAVDLEITSDGKAYVLADTGDIIPCRVVSPKAATDQTE